jgi:hypothetical protein
MIHLSVVYIGLSQPGVAAEQIKTGVELSAQMPSKTAPIKLTWHNIGDRMCLLNLGGIAGGRPLYIIKMTATWAENGNAKTATINVGGGSDYVGRPDPFVVPLPPKASYNIAVFPEDLRLPNGASIGRMTGTPIKIKVVFAGVPGIDYKPGGQRIPFSLSANGPTTLPFFTGSLSAEIEVR